MEKPKGKMYILLIGLAMTRENIQKCLVTNCHLRSHFGVVLSPRFFTVSGVQSQ